VVGGDRTELRLTHELFDSDEIRERHTHGWVGCLDSLERGLTTRGS
jgi:hypothetical protein